MLSKSSLTIVAIVGLGAAGLGTAAWIRPSLAQFPLSRAQGPSQTKAMAPIRPGDAPEAETSSQRPRLARILKAVHSYISRTENSSFPPPAITDDSGQPLLSWRVAILPYLDQNELYEQFHLNEPWDSPHNKTLIDRMPEVFEIPGETDSKGRTHIRGFAGTGTVFDPALTTAVGLNGSDLPGGMMAMMGSAAPASAGGAAQNDAPNGKSDPGMMSAMMGGRSPVHPRGVGLAEITDGTSNTVFVAIARDATVWTRPGELPFVPGQDLPALDESNPEGYVLGMCDGRVRLFKKDARPLTVTALITRDGGEIVSSDVYADAIVPPITSGDDPTSPPTGTAPGSSSVEQRLQKLEEKVDRILEKLDAL